MALEIAVSLGGIDSLGGPEGYRQKKEECVERSRQLSAAY